MPLVLTIQDVRDYVVDTRPEDNELLQDLDFTDPQIRLAMRLFAGAFNDLLPHTLSISPTQIPLVDWALEGIKEQLYNMRLNQLERNHFEYQAGNTAFDEDGQRIKNLREAMARASNWRTPAALQKRRKNFSNFYDV